MQEVESVRDEKRVPETSTVPAPLRERIGADKVVATKEDDEEVKREVGVNVRAHPSCARIQGDERMTS